MTSFAVVLQSTCSEDAGCKEDQASRDATIMAQLEAWMADRWILNKYF